MKVAIAHSSKRSIEIIERVLAREQTLTMAWTAGDGAEAIRRCKEDPPALLLLDLDLALQRPDGVEITRRIMAEAPCAILILAAAVSERFSSVYDAMGAGALDAINTPDGSVGGDELLAKIAMVRRLLGAPGATSDRTTPKRNDDVPMLIALGASTGGPQALVTLVTALPRDLDAAVVIVQHFDRQFAPGFVDWLSEKAGMSVKMVTEGKRPERGVVLVGATNDHLIMGEDRALSYTPDPRATPYRPSVDVFFESAAKHWPKRSIAALLTGMGRDGAKGLLKLRAAGWLTIAQDEATSVVYGMPKAAAEIAAAMYVLPIDQIAKRIVEHVTKSASGR